MRYESACLTICYFCNELVSCPGGVPCLSRTAFWERLQLYFFVLYSPVLQGPVLYCSVLLCDRMNESALTLEWTLPLASRCDCYISFSVTVKAAGTRHKQVQICAVRYYCSQHMIGEVPLPSSVKGNYKWIMFGCLSGVWVTISQHVSLKGEQQLHRKQHIG